MTWGCGGGLLALFCDDVVLLNSSFTNNSALYEVSAMICCLPLI